MSSTPQIVFTEKERQHFNHPKSIYKSPEEDMEKRSSKVKKTCTKCNKDKYLYEFAGNTSSSCGMDSAGYRLRRPECKECQNSDQDSKKIAIKHAKSMGIPTSAPEGSACFNCKKIKPLVFDHCHKTCRFRGYLCDPCNRSIGVLGDGFDGIINTLNYLNTFYKKKIVQNDDGVVVIVEDT